MVKVKKQVKIGDELIVEKEFTTWVTKFEKGDFVKVTGIGPRGYDIIHEETGEKATEVSPIHFQTKEEFLDVEIKGVAALPVKKGDVVIGYGKHSCDVRFVEQADENGILLVNGREDEFYSSESFVLFERNYKILCKKENREDL